MIPRHVAPSGAPIRLGDLARAVAVSLSGGDVAYELRAAISERFGARHAFLISTGRAGLTLLLRALRTLAPAQRTEIVLPSYTCYSVAASIVKAGLVPRIVDIVPETLGFDTAALEAVDCSRVLAIVATNLYGLPNDLPWLEAFARRRGVFLIDDAAQAMGASVGGRASGTWGDAGLFSFDKGKNVSAIDGGVVVTSSSRIAGALEDELRRAGAPAPGDSGVALVKALAYSILLRPSLYWIPNSVPQLELGKTVFTTEYPLRQPNRLLTSLAVTMLDRLEEFTRARVANAASLAGALRSFPGIRLVQPVPGACPVYLRLPVFIEDEQARGRVFARLTRAGIGATGSYPESIVDIPQLNRAVGADSRFVGGRYVARHILTLPTHAFVTAADVERTVAAIGGEANTVLRALTTA